MAPAITSSLLASMIVLCLHSNPAQAGVDPDKRGKAVTSAKLVVNERLGMDNANVKKFLCHTIGTLHGLGDKDALVAPPTGQTYSAAELEIHLKQRLDSKRAKNPPDTVRNAADDAVVKCVMDEVKKVLAKKPDKSKWEELLDKAIAGSGFCEDENADTKAKVFTAAKSKAKTYLNTRCKTKDRLVDKLQYESAKDVFHAMDVGDVVGAANTQPYSATNFAKELKGTMNPKNVAALVPEVDASIKCVVAVAKEVLKTPVKKALWEDAFDKEFENRVDCK